MIGKLAGPNASQYAFGAFMVAVFLTGGGSRGDIQSLIILRPLAILLGAYALWAMPPGRWKGRLFPLYITFALLALMLLQLVPLPPSIWGMLPGRGIFIDIADLAEIEQPWRPLTLSPSRTLNSLFSLAVPVTAIMLYLNLDETRRKSAIAIIIVLTTVSALWAILQITGPSRGPLYLYNITNEGAAVGLFANRNHQSVLLAATISMLGWYASHSAYRARFASVKFYASISAMLVFLPLIFITGSRAGLVLMAPAIAMAAMLAYCGRYSKEQELQKQRPKKREWYYLPSQKIILIVCIIFVLAIVFLSIYSSRSLAFDRLFGNGEPEELRNLLLPTLIRMMNEYLSWGAGFGAFEHAYKIYEPQALLRPTYLNQAHNDWLQFPIEGGAPAILIGAVAVIWFVVKLGVVLTNWGRSRYTKYTALMAAFVLVCFLAASAGDYPLRVPSLMAVFGVIACIFNDAVISIGGKRTEVAS
tara:strand:- start:575 stop:1996 length:1422 start_codon:yes stop_codon:yes gene_type:complete